MVEPVLAPTATRIPPEARGRVLVCGSHGAVFAGYLAATAGVQAVILNDAGEGLDWAGIGALEYCEGFDMAAATVDHASARIGDAADMLARGIISHVNAVAAGTGAGPGMSCREACARLRSAPTLIGDPTPYPEARRVVGANRQGLRIVCVDSISLVGPEDEGQVVLSGSHGGVVAGQPHLVIKVDAAAAFYNDAGIGMDEAGVSRLPLLDERGIAAATVSADSARIGDGISTYETGIISRVNGHAVARGLREGMPAREAVQLIGPV